MPDRLAYQPIFYGHVRRVGHPYIGTATDRRSRDLGTDRFGKETALFGDGVDEAGDGRIYRRGTSAEAKEALRRQFRFLPKFREVLPVPVPAPEALVDDVLIYRKLPGHL